MGYGKGARVRRDRLWRWRSNPLRRRDDIIEAWILVVLWAVVVAGGTAAALVAVRPALDAFARERAERRPVTAVLLADVPERPVSVESRGMGTFGTVRWAAADGTVHRGRARLEPDAAGLRSGARVTVWLDARGALTAEPTGATEGAVEAGLFGLSAASAVAGVAYGAASWSRARLDRRRLARWDGEWECVGPGWTQRAG
ncbi:hypothetical protein AB0L04_10215 [Streptomyces glaucescens]|uniref:Rv1733c family protein n=1 Tax=Streptomyces glaucescens TaxID=1907 RepID=UPI00344DD090